MGVGGNGNGNEPLGMGGNGIEKDYQFLVNKRFINYIPAHLYCADRGHLPNTPVYVQRTSLGHGT